MSRSVLLPKRPSRWLAGPFDAAVGSVGLCVSVLTIGCYLLGQAIEDALNPRLKVAHLSARGFRLRPLVGTGRQAL